MRDRGPPTVLVIEDNPVTLKMVRIALTAAGYRVAEAADARTAVERMRGDAPDVVVQDLVLPDMEGFALLARLREAAGTRSVPILAFSGLLPKVEEARALSAGFDDFLVKPVEPSRLVEVVGRYAPLHELPAPGRAPAPRVLVVDDSPVQRKLLRLTLQQSGFQVETAASAAEALERVRTAPPDAVLSDVLMPAMDGFRLCWAIRNDPALARVPVVLVSSHYLEADDAALGRRVGASAFVLRTPGHDDAVEALRDSLARPAPAVAAASEEEVVREYTMRALRQLDRQVAANAAILDRTAARAAGLAVLGGIARALAEREDVDVALQESLYQCLDAAALSTAALFVAGEDGGLRLRTAAGLGSRAAAAAEGLFGHPDLLRHALEAGAPIPLPCDAVAEDVSRRVLGASEAHSALLLPIGFRGERLGVLYVASSAEAVREDWVAFAEAVAVQFGQVIALARSFQRVTAAEERYRTLFEYGVVGVYQATPAGRFLLANPAAARIFGYASPEELLASVDDIGRQLYVDPQRRAELVSQLEATGIVEVFPSRIRRKDGRLAWIGENARIVRDEQGAVHHYEGMLVDITKQREAELRLATQYAVTRCLARAASPAEATASLLRAIGETGGWDFADLWSPSADGALVCEATWCGPGFDAGEFAAATSPLRVREGEGLPGRASASGAVEWVSEPARPWAAPRAGAARQVGLRSGFALPVRAGDRVLHVIGLYSRERVDHDPDLLETLDALGRQIGESLERKRVEEERAHAQAALRQNEQRFRKLVEHSSEAITLLSADGAILYGTPASTRILGFEPEEFVGRSIFELVQVEDRNDLAERLLEALRRPGEPVAVAARARHRDGSWRHLEGILSNLLNEPGVAAVVANYRDVTERREAEEALRASEARLRAIFDSSAIGIVQVDAAGRIIDVNPALAALLAYSPAELRGTPVGDIAHPKDVALDLDHFKDLVDGTTDRYQIEKRYVRKDGSSVHGRLTASAVRDRHGRTQFVIGLVEDVTERERLEGQLRQAQKMEAIGQLAGGVAHDFNNLLGIITGYSELLEKDLGPGHRGLGRLQQVRRAADRAAGLTRQLLAFSRKQILQPRVLDLGEAVSDVEKMLRRLIGEDVQVVTIFGPGLGRVMADSGQIEQVLVNLAVNARDAMPGGGKLIVETANADLDEAYARNHAGVVPGRYVLLSVSDTGHGMDAEVLSHIFEPFFTTKKEGKGTGLGLATVYGVVKQSGGHVSVYSEPGRGTTFRVYLPRTADQGREEPPPAPEPPPRGTETVMLVEDAEVLRLMMRELLELNGYRVLEIARPEEAAAAAAAYDGEIHLLVTDVVMPNLSGRETAESVRARRPGIRVLYVSGYTDDVITHHGVLEAGTHLLQKPFTTQAFLRKVRDVLDEAPQPVI